MPVSASNKGSGAEYPFNRGHFNIINIMSNEGNGRGILSRGGRRRGGLLSSAVRGVAGGIGLVSESVSAYKEKRSAEKQAESSNPGQQPQTNNSASASNETPQNEHLQPVQQEDSTERQWELDETQADLLSNPQGTDTLPQATQDDADLAASFLQAHSSITPPFDQGPSRLELPVILAQRRPKDRTRGFIRGYAPSLETVGIDQAAWLDFLDKFDESTRASPWIEVINLASIGGNFVPLASGMAINAAVCLAVDVAKNVQNRQRTNKFLAKMNEEYFYPKGLYCLVMTWRQDSGKPHEIVDLTSTVASSIGSYNDGLSNKFKSSSGKTYGDVALPEAAPLVFPALDVLAAADSEESSRLKQSLGEKKNYIQDYYDKRARSEFAHNNPENLLANQQEKPQFASRYADPNHPSNNGSLLSLVTGGYVDPTRLRQGFRGQSSGSHGRGRGRLGGVRGGRSGPILSQKPIGTAKKFLLGKVRFYADQDIHQMSCANTGIKDVLYLMVVNMPTEEELNEAKDLMSQK
ncbi:hypothetical protein FSARC_389 [Fusarium sarcochroum]|uniref:Uncharacterized protein n=1 Tax=Fusarium sarcochroum TaxID=1208366 RepID=A0A8H4UC04_9HYPO|nr:hypothetical protein FSARC_389 [Fusarium sarcochroum]